MKVIYFDIGDTLGTVEVSPSNRLLRIYPFASLKFENEGELSH